jgi:hypothetical protein
VGQHAEPQQQLQQGEEAIDEQHATANPQLPMPNDLHLEGIITDLEKAAYGDNQAWSQLLTPSETWKKRMQTGEIQEDDIDFDIQVDTETALLNAVNSLEGGSIRKATRTLVSNGIAPDTPRVRQQLISMNPPRSETLHCSQNTEGPEFTKAQVRTQTNGMSRDSSPGPSGFTVNLLKKLGATDRGLSALTQMVNKLVNGAAPAQMLTASRLVPLVKTRNKVRPIAVGEVLLRLAARCLGKRLQKHFSQHFRPLQFGVKEPQGTEPVIHAVRRDLTRGYTALNADISNAFNTISREKIRQQLQEHFPMLLPYFQSSYATGAPLYYKGDILAYSREGVRQGDPLGPALFALGLHPVLQQLRAEFTEVGIYAYLDDVTFTGPLSQLSQLFARFRQLCEDIGLQVNLDKSNIIPSDTDTSHENLPDNLAGLTLCRNGTELLGAPIGTPEYENERCRQKVQNLKKLLLVRTEKSIPCQYRFLLLKDSVIPTLNYLLRTVPPSNRTGATNAFDNAVRDIVKDILGGPEWGNPRKVEDCHQIYLPLRYGGLGVTKAKHISEAAYLASVWEARIQLDTSTRNELVGKLKRKKAEIEEEWLFSPPPLRKQQATLSSQIHDANFHWLLQRHQQRQQTAAQARLQAARQAGAQDWLTALPTKPCQRYTDLQWRLLARLRLGLPVSQHQLPGQCPLCQALVDDLGLHALACSHREMRQHRDNRHNQLRDALIGSFLHWGIITEKEPSIQEGSLERGDIEIAQPQGPVVLDVSVTSFTSINTKHQQKRTPSAATTVREREKTNKYETSCTQQNKEFRPLVFQNLGGIGNKGLDFLKELKSRPPCMRVSNSAQFVEATRKKLGCLLMHSNAHMVLRWLHLVLPPDRGGVRGIE